MGKTQRAGERRAAVMEFCIQTAKAVREKKGMRGGCGAGESRRSTRQSRQFEMKTEKRKRNLGEA